MREFVSQEFYSGQGMNAGWWTFGQRVDSSTPLYPARLSLKVSSLLKSRRIYAYMFAGPVEPDFQFLTARISFYLTGTLQLALPFTFFNAASASLQNQTGFRSSLISLPVSGGLADADALGMALYFPLNGGEPATVLLQPLAVNFSCDKINLDILGMSNCTPDGTAIDTNGCRFFLASLAV